MLQIIQCSNMNEQIVLISSDDETESELVCGIKEKKKKQISRHIEECLNDFSKYEEKQALSAIYIKSLEGINIRDIQRAADVTSLLLNNLNNGLFLPAEREVITVSSSDESQSSDNETTSIFAESDKKLQSASKRSNERFSDEDTFEFRTLSSSLSHLSNEKFDDRATQGPYMPSKSRVKETKEPFVGTTDIAVTDDDDILPPARFFGYPTILLDRPSTEVSCTSPLPKISKRSGETTPSIDKKPRLSPVLSPIANAFHKARVQLPSFDTELKLGWTVIFPGNFLRTANSTSRKTHLLTENQQGIILEDDRHESNSFYLRCLLGYAFESRIPTKSFLEKVFLRTRDEKCKLKKILASVDLMRRLNGIGIIRNSNFPLTWTTVLEKWFTTGSESNFFSISALCEILERDYLRLRDVQNLSIICTLLSPNTYSGARLTEISCWLKDTLHLYETCYQDESEMCDNVLAHIHIIQHLLGTVFQMAQNPRDFTERMVEIYVSCYIDLTLYDSKVVLIDTIEPVFVKRKSLEVLMDIVSSKPVHTDLEWETKPLSLAKVLYFYCKLEPQPLPSVNQCKVMEHVMLLVSLFRCCLQQEIPDLSHALSCKTSKSINDKFMPLRANLSGIDLVALLETSSLVDAMAERLHMLAGPLNTKLKLKLSVFKTLARLALTRVTES